MDAILWQEGNYFLILFDLSNELHIWWLAIWKIIFHAETVELSHQIQYKNIFCGPAQWTMFLNSHKYVTSTNIAVTLAEFLLFLQNQGNGWKEVKIITSMSKLRAAAEQTELVGSVRNLC